VSEFAYLVRLAFEASNEEDARVTVDGDPSVAGGGQSAELFPFKTALVGRAP
jgi:hypothetical protein